MFITISASPEQSSSQMGVEDESIPFPNINTPPTTPLHSPVKHDKLHPLNQGLTPSSPTLHTPSASAPIGLESPSALPDLNPIVPPPSFTEEQGNTSPPGHTSSSLSEKYFEGDLIEDKGTEFNILAKGPELVDKNLLGRKDGDQDVRKEPTSPDVTLAVGTLIFDQTPVMILNQ